ncbi:MAG TPA: glycosyltransferase [Candidatus Bathyarchaeia archaeon]|nr:glycosyltransferase [Candidatus Bathyarchaeia archaeon]
MKKAYQKPDFSIIVPTYNEEKYIFQCLEAIKNQNFTGSWETIIIDSFSTDKTVAIAKQFNTKLFQAKREGPGLAKRTGCLKAQADLIALTDADICLPRNWLQKAYQNLQNPLVSATGGPYLYREMSKPLAFINKTIHLWLLKSFQALPGGSIAFRRQDYFNVGGIPTGVTFGEDVYISRKLSKIGKILVDPKLTVIESGRRIGISGLISGKYSYLIHAWKFLRTGDFEVLKKTRMKKID